MMLQALRIPKGFIDTPLKTQNDFKTHIEIDTGFRGNGSPYFVQMKSIDIQRTKLQKIRKKNLDYNHIRIIIIFVRKFYGKLQHFV